MKSECSNAEQSGTHQKPSLLAYGGLEAIANAIGYAEHHNHSRDALIRVYDAIGDVIETHEH